MHLGLPLALGSPLAGGGTSAPPAGASATAWSLAATYHFHPHSQRGTAGYTTSGGRVTACPNLVAANPTFAAVALSAGPVEFQDALGRWCWRFVGDGALAVANALNAINNRDYNILAVARIHHHISECMVACTRYASYTSDAVNTAPNANVKHLRAVVGGGGAGTFVGDCGTPTPYSAANSADLVVGAQLQVMAVASRVTGSGGINRYLNNAKATFAQAGTSGPSHTGMLIGASPSGDNTTNVNIGSNQQNAFDLYEIAFWRSPGGVANDFDAQVAAAVTNFDIPTVTDQIIGMGGSQMANIATVLATSPWPAQPFSERLTRPGLELVPRTTRVLNLGKSGAGIADMIAMRDGTNTVFDKGLMSGGASKNVVVLHVGRNDWAAGLNSQEFYDAMIPFWNTTTTGVLQRGFAAVMCASIAIPGTACTEEIAGETTLQKRNENVRAKIVNDATDAPVPQFLTDTLTNTGQAYDGLMRVLPIYKISDGGQQWFLDQTNASDMADAVPPGPYDSDGLHLVLAGSDLMASGGSTPQYGLGSLV